MHLDRSGEKLHLRLVFAGPRASGKSTLIRALGATAREDRGSADDPSGIPFDWAEYEGGLYQGCVIHCQLVGVPGDDARMNVRRLLVSEADAVVFVADARRARLEENRRALAELRPWLERGGLPRVEVVLHLTFTSEISAYTTEEMPKLLGIESTVETFGKGAFDARLALLGAVRAGIRRADALRARDKLPLGPPEITTAAQLARRLQQPDAAATDPARRSPKGVDRVAAPSAPSRSTSPKPAPSVSEPSPSPSSPSSPSSSPSSPSSSSPSPADPNARPPVIPMAVWVESGAPTPPAPPPRKRKGRRPSKSEPADPDVRPAVMPLSDWLRISAENRPPEPVPVVPVVHADGAAPAVDSPVPGLRIALDSDGTPIAVDKSGAPIALDRSGRPLPPGATPAAAPARQADPPAVAVADEAATPVEAPRAPEKPARPGLVAEPARPIDLSALGPPTPWVAECAWDLVEAWPPTMWASVLDSARTGTARDWANIGRGWHARAAPITEDAAHPRAEFERLVVWMAQVGDWASRNRCVALTRAGAAGRWCVLQLVQRSPTLDGLVRAALEPGLPSKRVTQLLARAAETFLLASGDFEREGVHLPIKFKTITRLDRRALYADFLPPRPVPIPEQPPSMRLEAELRALLGREWLGGPAVPPVLDELLKLSRSTPQAFPVASVLQTVLMDE